MMNIKIIAIFLFICLEISHGKPAAWILTGNVLVPVNINEEALEEVTGYCFKLSCPKETRTCGKRSEVSEDRTVLNNEIQCLDAFENILKAENFSEANPYDPSVYFKGMQISSVKQSRSFTETKWNEDGVVLPRKSKKESRKEISNILPKSGSGPKSEVEDLLDV